MKNNWQHELLDMQMADRMETPKIADEDHNDDLYPSEEDEDYSDCGWTPGGGCSMAGSEECDFECPNRYAMIAELNRK